MNGQVFPIGHGKHSNNFWRNAWRLVHPYWHSEEWLKAWGLLTLILTLSFANVGMSVAYNHWHRHIYDSLEARDSAAFGQLLIIFLGIAAATILMSAYSRYLKSILMIRWRRWLLYGYFDAWIEDSRHYAVQLIAPVDNPDQRLTEDVETFTRLTLETALGFIQTITSLASFAIILWTVSGDIEIFGVTIPGYMFWSALFYSGLGSVFTHLIGRRLIALNNRQQRVEADVRYDLMRIRENSENIALQHGERSEQLRLRERFGEVWENFHKLVRTEKNLAFFIAGYSQFSFVFPLAVAGPRLFSGALQFGQLMQLNQAFSNLQSNLSWFIAVYHDLVEWRAVSDRLLGFDKALSKVISIPKRIQIKSSQGEGVNIERLEICQPNGQSLLRLKNLAFQEGKHVLIQGPSGAGKSTLLRALAGLWRFGDGDLTVPENAYVIPQRPYFPVGSLRQALLYPYCETIPSDYEIKIALRACRLGHLTAQLDENGHWEKTLSPGEQQRFAIARAVLAKPDFLLLDEITSALSYSDEDLVYRLIRRAMPRSTIISIGHRNSLAAHHDTLWKLTQHGQIEQSLLDTEGVKK